MELKDMRFKFTDEKEFRTVSAWMTFTVMRARNVECMLPLIII